MFRCQIPYQFFNIILKNRFKGDGEVTMVTGIEKTTSDNGFYNPITASTSVVVNGIVASTFTMDLGLFTSAAMLSIWTTIISGVEKK